MLQVPSVDDNFRPRPHRCWPIAIEDLVNARGAGRSQLLGPGICDAWSASPGLAVQSVRSFVADPELVAGKAHSSRAEPALYAIEQELRELVSERVVVKPVLGSATDPKLLKGLFAEQRVEETVPLLINMCSRGANPWRAWPITSAPLTRFVLFIAVCVR